MRITHKALVPLGLAAVIVAALVLSLRHDAGTPSGSRSIGSARPAAGRVTVAVSNFAFAPARLTVTAGTRVTWTNHDATAHTATADQNRFDTGTINPRHAQTIALLRPGTYTYHCDFHAFMTATITVVR